MTKCGTDYWDIPSMALRRDLALEDALLSSLGSTVAFSSYFFNLFLLSLLSLLLLLLFLFLLLLLFILLLLLLLVLLLGVLYIIHCFVFTEPCSTVYMEYYNHYIIFLLPDIYVVANSSGEQFAMKLHR